MTSTEKDIIKNLLTAYTFIGYNGKNKYQLQISGKFGDKCLSEKQKMVLTNVRFPYFLEDWKTDYDTVNRYFIDSYGEYGKYWVEADYILNKYYK